MEKRRICLHGAMLGLLLLLCFSIHVSGDRLTHPLEVSALKAVRRKLKDPYKNLRNWKKTDPCKPRKEWNGVICTKHQEDDAYLHIEELRLLNMNLSGTLSPQLGQFPNMTILDFMRNNISGSIPKEIGNMSSLYFLLLTGNQISGPLPDELGYLPNIHMFQVDENYISGPLPKSFANLRNCKHFHMNNNSINGQIPAELSALPQLEHILLDNNKLTGYLPPELSQMPNLTVLQLDNNNFEGTEIPASYGNMSKLFKLSLRDCNLQGNVPDFSTIPDLLYLDLSSNKLTGSIPTNKLSDNITTIDLSYNMLIGSIPSNFSDLPKLQRLSLENNLLTGDVPADIWMDMKFTAASKLTMNFEYNLLENISDSLNPPPNVTILNGTILFRTSEIQHICDQFATFQFPGNKFFGPYDLLNFSLKGEYSNIIIMPPGSGMSKGQIAGIVLGSISCAATLLLAIALIYNKTHPGFQQKVLKNKSIQKNPIKFEGVKGFSFDELKTETNNFSIATQVGQGGYGKVYKGILADGTIVAIKRAQQASLQSEKEFLTEIELL